MRIFYITNVRIPTHKAAGYAIMKMCSEFAKAGVETRLFVPSKGNNDILESPFDFYKIKPDFAIEKVSSFDLLGLTLKFGKIFYWIDVLSFFLASRRKVGPQKGDVVYSRDFLTAIFFGRKNFVCLELHSIPTSKFLFDRAVRRASRFVVLNAYLKAALLERGVEEGRIYVAPSGVDMGEFTEIKEKKEVPGLSESDFVYGYIGTLRTMGMEKGVSMGLLALVNLPPEYKFLVAGGEISEIEFYKREAETLGVADRAVFVGKVTFEMRSSYGALCNAFVAPFPENEHYSFFMSPLKIFEYMASKKPIIATNLPSIKEVLRDGENAILIQANDPKALADALVKLKSNPETGTMLAEKAFAEVLERYTWEKRAQNIISFIKP